MAVEIERKYLVDVENWNRSEKGVKHFYRQGYILTEPEKTIRVRVTDDSGFVTIKGRSVGAARPEYEYPIPKQDAIELLDQFCSSEISKYRYTVQFADKVWEVDEFLGENEGLIVAEIELTDEDEIFQVPAWVSKEVTGIKEYYNANLAERPFKYWQ